MVNEKWMDTGLRVGPMCRELSTRCGARGSGERSGCSVTGSHRAGATRRSPRGLAKEGGRPEPEVVTGPERPVARRSASAHRTKRSNQRSAVQKARDARARGLSFARGAVDLFIPVSVEQPREFVGLDMERPAVLDCRLEVAPFSVHRPAVFANASSGLTTAVLPDGSGIELFRLRNRVAVRDRARRMLPADLGEVRPAPSRLRWIGARPRTGRNRAVRPDEGWYEGSIATRSVSRPLRRFPVRSGAVAVPGDGRTGRDRAASGGRPGRAGAFHGAEVRLEALESSCATHG